MHAIDTAGSIQGQFSEGNPAIGQRATKVGAAWLNDLQANILAVLTEGQVAPTKGRAADLVDAIKAVAAGVGGAGQQQGVPTARTITGAGLVTGGGDLTQNRVLTVTRASAAEVLAGTADDRAITPLAYAQATAGNVAGYSATTGPLIFKRGDLIGNYGPGAVYVAFPVAFPTECWGVMPVARNDTGSSSADMGVQLIGRPTKDGFTVMLQDPGGSNNHSITGFEWSAFGR